jgi:hypothetical protein
MQQAKHLQGLARLLKGLRAHFLLDLHGIVRIFVSYKEDFLCVMDPQIKAPASCLRMMILRQVASEG